MDKLSGYELDIKGSSPFGDNILLGGNSVGSECLSDTQVVRGSSPLSPTIYI